MKEKGTNRPLFKIIRLRKMCAECQGRKDMDVCPHAHLMDPPYERPPWISREDEARLRELYRNNIVALRREIYGLQESSNTPGMIQTTPRILSHTANTHICLCVSQCSPRTR
jgi:hypothetical protein